MKDEERNPRVAAVKRSVMLVVNGFGVGGGELKLLELASLLSRDKYAITIVSVGQGGELEARFRALGYPTHVLPKAFGFDPRLPWRLARLMRAVKTELVMSTLFYADIISALATFFYRPKALLSWEVITGQLEWYQVLAYRLLAGRFDHVAAVSDSIHPFIRGSRGMKSTRISTIYYGVDLEKFQPPMRPAVERLVFGTVARLVYQKGHTWLLDAIPAVLERYPQARWRFAGDGDKRAGLEAQAQRLGIAHAVEFLGSRTDVQSLLAEFDLFVLPSLWEGFPNVLLEAMACGLPVIATAVEGTVEMVVDGETGRLVAKENAGALTAAMLELAAAPELRARMGRQGRQRVERRFSLGQQVRQFEALFDRFLL
ncbi:MAG TPA: glycosyltransferase [bacterium]|nr:glycosyltransferase [bacterium]HPR87837.1 glycosyltransferase [bacterium]